MKKKTICIILVVSLIFSTAMLLVGCRTKEKSIELDNTVANIVGATELAIANNEDKNLAVTNKNSKDNNYATHGEMLLKRNSAGEYTEVTFKNSKNKEITLSDSGYIPIKLHSDNKFTFLSICEKSALKFEVDVTLNMDYYKDFIYPSASLNHTVKAYSMKSKEASSPILSEPSEAITPTLYSKYRVIKNGEVYNRSYAVPSNYDYTYYIYNKYVQSYIIDNTTGIVYSSSDIGTFDIVDQSILRVYDGEKALYKTITVVDGKLKLNNIVSNDNITVHNVAIDKYGVKYIYNDILNNYVDNDEKAIYYTEKLKYYFDEKGNAYNFDSSKNSAIIMNGLSAMPFDYSKKGFIAFAPASKDMGSRKTIHTAIINDLKLPKEFMISEYERISYRDGYILIREYGLELTNKDGQNIENVRELKTNSVRNFTINTTQTIIESTSKDESNTHFMIFNASNNIYQAPYSKLTYDVGAEEEILSTAGTDSAIPVMIDGELFYQKVCKEITPTGNSITIVKFMNGKLTLVPAIEIEILKGILISKAMPAIK